MSSKPWKEDSKNQPALQVGDLIQARFNGKAQWYNGKVKRVRKEGKLYDIKYDDGDSERGVKKNMVRSLEGGKKKKKKKKSGSDSDSSSSSDDDEKLERGTEVEANYGGKGKWYKGKIDRVNSNGTFDIKYADGDSERRVDKSRVRSLNKSKKKKKKKKGSDSGSGSDDDNKKFERGEKVEARYGGKTKWYKGKIALARSDGTYDIVYEDGDRERSVKKNLIRKIGGSGGKSDRKPWQSSANNSDASDFDGGGRLEVETKVEARYGGRSRWVPGVIVKVNSGGTFRIRYDDGKEEKFVRRNLIRVKKKKKKKNKSGSDSDSGSSDGGKLERGTKVEANYGGKGKWYKGKIDRVNRNGTFDIKYDDGDSERGVRKNMVRSLEGGKKKKKKKKSGSDSDSSSSSSDDDDEKLERGTEVEANYGGKGKWYKGKIDRVNSNGTFDIKYDDGDSERRVDKSRVRALKKSKKKKKKKKGSDSDSGSDDDSKKLERGQKVEARYGGKTKWYKGKIALARSDGTYDIIYEDGDRERNVKRNLIRKI